MSSSVETVRAIGAQTVTLYDSSHPLMLESGKSISPVDVTFESWGTLNAAGTNAILLCHALTANAHAGSTNDAEPGWWDALIGPGRAFDTNNYFVVCPNILGSCYGTTGPASIDPTTGHPYGPDFPFITVRDIVRVQRRLLDALGVSKLATIVGSSLGAMQVLEWGLLFPELCSSLIPISTSAAQTTWCLALNAIARAAITGDPAWMEGRYDHQPEQGLTVARMVGMVSYRSPQEFASRFGRSRIGTDPYDASNMFQVESYLRHQGRKLVERFDANTYLTLSRAMDAHDVAAGHGDAERVLGRITAPTLCIGISSDIRYPLDDQRFLAKHIPHAQLAVIDSPHGHDAFLIEFEQLTAAISEFLRSA